MSLEIGKYYFLATPCISSTVLCAAFKGVKREMQNVLLAGVVWSMFYEDFFRPPAD